MPKPERFADKPNRGSKYAIDNPLYIKSEQYEWGWAKIPQEEAELYWLREQNVLIIYLWMSFTLLSSYLYFWNNSLDEWRKSSDRLRQLHGKNQQLHPWGQIYHHLTTRQQDQVCTSHHQTPQIQPTRPRSHQNDDRPKEKSGPPQLFSQYW